MDQPSTQPPKPDAGTKSLSTGAQVGIAVLVVVVVGVVIALAVIFGGNRINISTSSDTGTGYPPGTPLPTHIERLDNAPEIAPVTFTYQVTYNNPVTGTTLDLFNAGTADVTFGTAIFSSSNRVLFTVTANTSGLVEPGIGPDNDVRTIVSDSVPAPNTPFTDPTLSAVQVYEAGTPLPLSITRTDNNPTTPGVTLSFVIHWSQPVTVNTVVLRNTGTAADVSLSTPTTSIAETHFDVTVPGTGTVQMELDGAVSDVVAVTGGKRLPVRATAVADLVTVEYMPPMPIRLTRTDSNTLEPGVTLQYELLWTEGVTVNNLVIDNTLGTAGAPVISALNTVGNLTTFDATFANAGDVELQMPASSSSVTSIITGEQMPNSATVVADRLTIPTLPPKLLSLARMNEDSFGWVGQRLYYQLTFDIAVAINSVTWDVGGTSGITFEDPTAIGASNTIFVARGIVTAAGTSDVSITDVDAVSLVGGTPIDPAHKTAASSYSEFFSAPNGISNERLVGDETANYVATGPFAATAAVPPNTSDFRVLAHSGDSHIRVWDASVLSQTPWTLNSLASAGSNSYSEGLLTLPDPDNGAKLTVAFCSEDPATTVSNKFIHTDDNGTTVTPPTPYASQTGSRLTRHGHAVPGSVGPITRAIFKTSATQVGVGVNSNPLADGGNWVIFSGARLTADPDYLTFLPDTRFPESVHIVEQSTVAPYPINLHTSTNAGASWETPVTVWAGNGVDRSCSACMNDGNLYVCWMDSTNATTPGVYFTRALTATTFATPAHITGTGVPLPTTAGLKMRMISMSLPTVMVEDAANKTIHVANLLAIDDSAPTASFTWQLVSRALTGTASIETGELGAAYKVLIIPVRRVDGVQSDMYTTLFTTLAT